MRTAVQMAEELQQANFADILVDWFNRQGRAFPWREDVSPYKIAVAEALLQKTSAKNVLPVFIMFINKYPTVTALAAADCDEIITDLKDLGLPRRALLLHQLAQEISRSHGGIFPDTERALRKLPGVGPYGAAAISALAFGRRAAMIDINVMRIFERLQGIKATPRSGPSKFLRQLLLSIIPEDQAAQFNLALVDFGALICKAKAPHCQACPISHLCLYYAHQKDHRTSK
jgi:A/G-specific adenine glycosylase